MHYSLPSGSTTLEFTNKAIPSKRVTARLRMDPLNTAKKCPAEKVNYIVVCWLLIWCSNQIEPPKIHQKSL